MFANIFYALKIAWKASSIRAISDFLIRFLYRTYVVFYNVFFLGYVLTTIENNANIRYIWLMIGISIFGMISYDLLAAWYYNTYKPYVDQDVKKKYKKLIYQKAANVDLEYYENPEFYDIYTKASSEITDRFDNVLGDVSELIVGILFNCFLFTTILGLDKFAAVIVFFPILVKSICGRNFNAEKYKLYTENVKANRRKGYIQRTVYLKEYSKEIHTSNVFHLMSGKFKDASDELIANIRKYGIKIAIWDFLNSSFVNIFSYFVAIIYASYRALVTRTLSVGEYIILVNAISRLSDMLIQFVDRIISLYDSAQYIGNIRFFLNISSDMDTGSDNIENKIIHNIEFKNVSFSYPGQAGDSLKNIDLHVGAGEKIAIVGLNGAGKTTLVKLLMRLYDVTVGEILINGVNIKKFPLHEYRDLFSTVFQDYKIYAATVEENVVLDTATDRGAEVDEALQNSGIYEYLSGQFGNKAKNQVLTKEFDCNGLVLSGGQFQKIAVARGFMKSGGIAILDEPSSALDPLAEKEMFQNLLSACKDKIVFFISHRLSAAALADRIYVMQDGMVAECGTHAQLMDYQGLYYNMYTKQHKKFIDGETDNGK